MDEALKQYKYTPYTGFSAAARLKAQRSDEEMVLNPSGSWSVKTTPRTDEHCITPIEWRAAARVVEDRMCAHHGEEREKMFRMHHLVVDGLAWSYGWDLAVEYDISQRELAAADWEHNLETLDQTALIRLALQAASIKVNTPAPATPSRKRSTLSGDSGTVSAKHIASGHCFRCGGTGHIPADCVASSTSAGRNPTPILQNGRNKNTLVATHGKQYCFTFARGACNAGGSCTNYHGCSICGETAHGAASCSKAA